ncbi:MAG: response regulator transcription factor [Deltaproteobacteria bacterium]|nr:response regulator transcription factor [Deltaproteobacteria bacterium]MBI4374367.1 response regulator transcription factor [Deltaproteobacteria bacterium]
MKILVAEDEPKVSSFIRKALNDAGFVTDVVTEPLELLTSLKSTSYDVLVLDRLMKGSDSIDYLPEIRRSSPGTKVLILSALSDVEDKVKGITEGGDDYLGKPFHVAELVARIRALLRREDQRKKGMKDTLLLVEDLKIDLETQRVYRGGKRVDLTGKEFRILCLLARNPGQIFSKTSLLDQVWDMNHYPESNLVEVTIANLRSKVDKGFKALIQSRRGLGYWLGEP